MSIRYLLVSNKSLQNLTQVKMTSIYYLIVSLGENSEQADLSGSSQGLS